MDIYSFVGIPVRFFRTIGLVPFHVLPDQTAPPPPTPTWMRVQFLCCMLHLGVCIIGCAVNFIQYGRQPSHFVLAVAVFLYLGFNVLSYAKTLTVLHSRPALTRILSELDAMFPRTVLECIAYRVDHWVHTALRLIRPYSVFQMMMIWFFNLFPLLDALVGLALSGGREWRIDYPYEIWYPVPYYERGWFELCYLNQFWGSYCAATGAMATDVLLCAVAAQVCMHFDRLSARVRAMKPRAGRNEAEEFAELTECVRTHMRIIEISQQLDNIFRMIILFNVMSSCAIVCTLGFLVTISSVSTELVKFGMALFTCVVQVLLISIFGDMFTESSVGVAAAAWECDWYNGSMRFKRGIRLLIQRAQRPQYLTAYKYTVVSMVMFSNVMSTSWQFFVLISSVYED